MWNRLFSLIFDSRNAAFLLACICAGLLAGALFFQHVLGIAPCLLCWWQRYAHIATLAFALIAAFSPTRRLRMSALVLSTLSVWTGAVVAAFHSGVERHFWSGFAGCTTPIQPAGISAADLLAQLEKTPFIPCDVIPWQLFGLSMANYNFLISLGLGAFALAIAGQMGADLRTRGR